jgi:hypothetical protein
VQESFVLNTWIVALHLCNILYSKARLNKKILPIKKVNGLHCSQRRMLCSQWRMPNLPR